MSTKTRRFEPDDNTIDVIATEHNADRGSVREAYRRAATLANQGHDREEITAELQQSMNLQGAVITVVVAGATAYAGINVMNSIAGSMSLNENSTFYNSSEALESGVESFFTNLPTVFVVIALVLIIGYLTLLR